MQQRDAKNTPQSTLALFPSQTECQLFEALLVASIKRQSLLKKRRAAFVLPSTPRTANT